MPKQKRTSGISRVDLIVLPGLTVLLVLALGLAAFNQIIPKGPNGARAPGNAARIGRYLRTGQWQADIRTVAAAFRYFVDPELAPAGDLNPPPTSGIAVVRSNTSPNLPNI